MPINRGNEIIPMRGTVFWEPPWLTFVQGGPDSGCQECRTLAAVLRRLLRRRNAGYEARASFRHARKVNVALTFINVRIGTGRIHEEGTLRR